MPKLFVLLLTILVISTPNTAHAVMPPDFVFSIGTQVVQFFSLILLAMTTVIGASFRFLQTKFANIKYKKTTILVTSLLCIAGALGAAYLFASYQQQAEMDAWLKASQTFGEPHSSSPLQEPSPEPEALAIGNTLPEHIDTTSSKFVSSVAGVDASSKFINAYYEAIATKQLQTAYNMSKKAVDYNTFKGWYTDVTKITIDRLTRIDEKTSSLELVLFEGNIFTRYGVLMTLTFENGQPTHVEKSEVKTLDRGVIEKSIPVFDEQALSQEYAFFDTYSQTGLSISNEALQAKFAQQNPNFIILDAREEIEYEIGHFPNSTHIRFADLKAGRWIELPKDKFIYVFCWSGMRGKEVATYLRTKKIVASYVETGANGWVTYGGQWEGGVKFVEQYTQEQYKRVIDTPTVKQQVTQGVLLVDAREPWRAQQQHIPGSINFPLMYTPTIDLESVFRLVPPKSKVITICDGYINCFDARLVGAELERRGHTFLGRYVTPWEYAK